MRFALLQAFTSTALFLGLLFLLPLDSFAQQVWSTAHYMSESGLLQNRVHVMVRDQWGALLIGTEGGFVRFDGDHFKQIGNLAHEGIRPTRVLDILPTGSGEFVIRDAGCRQYVYANNVLTPITADAPTRQFASRFSGAVPTAKVGIIAMDPDSTLAGKDQWTGIVRPVLISGDRWCVRTDEEILFYNDTVLTSRHPMPEGRSSHLFMLDSAMFTFDVHGKAFRIDTQSGTYEPVDMQGFPEVEMRNGYLGWRLFVEALDRKAMFIAHNHVYVLRSENGSMTLRAELLDVPLPDDAKVGAMLWMQDEDVLAVGTDTKGLFVFRRNTMHSLLCDVALDGVNNAFNGQAPFGNDAVLTSTRGGSRLFNSTGCLDLSAPIRGFDQMAVALDNEHRYWYGRGDTLFSYDAITQEERIVRKGLRPLCFLEESDTLWVGASNGIHRIVNGELSLVFPLSEGDLAFRPNALGRVPNGAFWMATCSGVYRTTVNGGWEAVPELAGICARTLTVYDGAMLVGSYGSGAFMVGHYGTLGLPFDEQGFLSHVHGFMPDSSGFLWMSTNQGLFRVKWADLKAWTADTTQRVFYAYYGKQAGINNSEFNGGCSPPYVRTRDGWASFPTMDGLVWFKPESIPDAYPVGDILVEGILVDGIPYSTDTVLSWDHREVIVRFSLSYWGDPENVRLEYQMTGLTGDRWVPLPVGQRELRFGGLPSGKVSLKLRKVGSALRGEPPLELLFRVPVPYYRSVWFVGLCVLGSGLLLWLVVRINAARLHRKNLQLERKVRERTGELVDANTVLRRSLEMKEMLVSIISHDIVTPLRFIARVANGAARGLGNGNTERLGGTLDDLARSSDKLHANAQDLLNWIKRQDGRIDLRIASVAVAGLVDSVMDMERERAMDQRVLLVNEVATDIVVRTDRNVLSIVLHNLLANAVTHTKQGSVTVLGAMQGDAYHLTVRDTGIGMPEAALRHAQRVQRKGALGAMNDEGERDVQGLGLLIVADLLELLGGRFSVESEAGIGTVITLTLPIDVLQDAGIEATEVDQ